MIKLCLLWVEGVKIVLNGDELMNPVTFGREEYQTNRHERLNPDVTHEEESFHTTS